jgi:tetratricopeptide (TPR) repeat protein
MPQSKTPQTRKCNWCQEEGVSLLCCSSCKLVDYCHKGCQSEDWNEGGHKVLCRKVPKAVAEAKLKIDSFQLSDYTTRNVGTFLVTDAEAERGQIKEEEHAQDMCYDAMDLPSGSTEKLKLILRALKIFPLSVEAWGMIGHFYDFEIDPKKSKAKECAMEALKMYQHAIASARKLNPSWTENRSQTLEWGEVSHRPYLRSIFGYACALHGVGRNTEAIEQSENLLRWNPNDNQGVRKIVCNWYLQENNIEDCLHLLRDHDTGHDSYLAYTDVLVQFLRWKRGKRCHDQENHSVQKALYKAIGANPYIPDMLLAEYYEEKIHDYLSPGETSEAESYANKAREVWRAHPDSLDWLRSQKFEGGSKVPDEMDLIKMLNNSNGHTDILVKSEHTDLHGRGRTVTTLKVTQKRDNCVGCGCSDFLWPDELNRPHKRSNAILMHHNKFSRGEDKWRKTKYSNVLEVPFWKVILQFVDED